MSEDHTARTYRCTECGAERDSRGRLHAHAERHRGLFGIQLPWRVGDVEVLEGMTEEVTNE